MGWAPTTPTSSSADVVQRERVMRSLSPSPLTRRAAIAGLSLFGLASAVQAADTVDRLGIPGPLAFDGTSYALAWSSHPSPAYYKQEYLPAGQSSANYTSMLIVELVDSGASVASAVQAQTRMLTARKATDPLVNFSLIQNQRIGDALLDFVMGGSTQRTPIAEWNAYRYAPYRGPNRQSGVMLFAISRRAYGDSDIKSFLSGLKQARLAVIDKLARTQLPAVRMSR
jgi:hypothetical protein